MELSSEVHTSKRANSEDAVHSDVAGYLAAAGQFGGGVKIFARTEGGKKLVEVAKFGIEGSQKPQPIGAKNVTTFLWL